MKMQAERARKAREKTPKRAKVALPKPPDGSLIGRRVGHGKDALEGALERPEKARRDRPVDTSLPGRSASDRKAGYGSTARRNAKKNTSAATAALEDSATGKPSRKSTRRSANRTKQATQLTGRTKRAVRSPKARATKPGASRGT